jgi:hypothetical protein
MYFEKLNVNVLFFAARAHFGTSAHNKIQTRSLIDFCVDEPGTPFFIVTPVTQGQKVVGCWSNPAPIPICTLHNVFQKGRTEHLWPVAQYFMFNQFFYGPSHRAHNSRFTVKV